MPHLYLHVPFCVRRCSYRDFSIAVRKRVPAGEYVDLIRRELELVRAADPGLTARGSADRGLDTLYLGGGTPSLLPPHAIHELLDAILGKLRIPHSAFRTDVEVTLEANPEDVTLEHATAWRRAGVNRVSLGAQSFDDRVLRWMHRSHDVACIGDAVGMLRRAGIDNVSLDLIFALPVELGRDWARDLDQALALEPSHLSLYGLRLSFLRGLERRPQRVALPPQRGLLVRAAVPRLRPGGALVRRPRAPLEPRGVGGVPARRRGRPLAGRIRGGPQRRATGTRAGLSVVAHR